MYGVGYATIFRIYAIHHEEENFFVCRRMKNHLAQNGFTGWIKTGTNAWKMEERQEEKSVFSSIWRPEVSSSVCRFVMIGVRMLTGLHGDADGWACRVSG